MIKCKERLNFWPLFLIKFIFVFAIGPTVGFAYHYIYKYDFHGDLHDPQAEDLLSFEREAREAETEGEGSFELKIDLVLEQKLPVSLPYSFSGSLITPFTQGHLFQIKIDLNQGPSPPFTFA